MGGPAVVDADVDLRFSKVELLVDSMFRWIEHSDEGDWTIIFAFMVVFGIICMRGYKSRL